MPNPQSYANHARYDPPFHFFVMPVAVITTISLIVRAVRFPSFWSIWLVVVGFAAIVLVLKARLYALKVQDRVIRLEERLRLMTVLPEKMRPRIAELTDGQLVGLRFACDDELPALCNRALDEQLTKKQIKQAVQNWRPDYMRV
jgi:hypothetical protein